MKTRTSLLAGSAVVVITCGLAAAVIVGVVGGHHRASHPGNLPAAQRTANSIVVPGLTPGTSCPNGKPHCYLGPKSVLSTSNAVFEAMQQQTHIVPRLRCFPHYAGDLPNPTQPDAGTLVDSCVVDVPVDGYTAYAWIDPVMSGPATHPVVHGSSVDFQAN